MINQIWRRFSGRFSHAVLVDVAGGYWTYCGQFVRDTAHLTPAAKRKCTFCQTRVRCPYLLPDKLQELAGVPHGGRSLSKRRREAPQLPLFEEVLF